MYVLAAGSMEKEHRQPGFLDDVAREASEHQFARTGVAVIWWPSQRPDIAMTDPNNIPTSQAGWADPIFITDHEAMVKHALQLGFIVPATNNAGHKVFIEQDRDPEFSRDQVIAMVGRNARVTVKG